MKESSKSLRSRIGERDNWVCGLCGYDINPNFVVFYSIWAPVVDHIVPKSHGGSWSDDNLQIAHFECNRLKGPRKDFKFTKDQILTLRVKQLENRETVSWIATPE